MTVSVYDTGVSTASIDVTDAKNAANSQRARAV